MTPIISPWVFYLMPIVDKINFIAVVSFSIGGVVALVAAIGLFVEGDPFPKWLKGIFIGLIFTLAVFIFTPSEKTITKMILAQNVTYERVEAVGDTVEAVYNDIMEILEDTE